MRSNGLVPRFFRSATSRWAFRSALAGSVGFSAVQPLVEQTLVGSIGGAGIHADQIFAGCQVGRVCGVRKALRSRHHTSDGAGARRHAEPSADERKMPKQCTKPTQDDNVTIQPTKETIKEAT